MVFLGESVMEDWLSKNSESPGVLRCSTLFSNVKIMTQANINIFKNTKQTNTKSLGSYPVMYTVCRNWVCILKTVGGDNDRSFFRV